MATPSKDKKYNQRLWERRIVVIIVIIASIAFVAATTWIWIRPGFLQAATFAGIIAALATVVVGLLGLMFNYFQWRHPVLHNEPGPSATHLLLEELSRHQSDESVLPIQRSIAEQSRFPGSLPPYWNVPHKRNPFFTDREEILKNLHDTLALGQAAALIQPFAMSGLGGIGKTQTAIEYAYRHHDKIQAVLWAKADSREALISDFVSIAGLLELPEKDDQNQSNTVWAVKRWLQEHNDWLVIFDNADDLAVVRDFIPPLGRGHILLTTRVQSTGKVAESIEIDQLNLHESMLLLLRRAKIIPKEASLDNAS